MRVLIADSHRSERAAMRLLLERDADEFVVEEATDAGTVLNALTAAPDLLLLDWDLPGLPPEQLLRRARQARPELVVVALSRRPEMREAAMAAGADCFINKNHPPPRFLETLYRLCPHALPGR